jgi:hypothetical protein
MTTATIDRLYDYPGYFGGPARCRLRIFHLGPDRPAVVIATELPDNPSTSITNRAEVLADLVAREFNIDADTMLWVEHYAADRILPERYSVVEFQADPRTGRPCKPHWRHLTRQAVEALVGPLP